MTAIVFPGQGSQFLGMTKDFYDQFSVARETFELIEDVTKIQLREIIFEDRSELLNITQFTQLSIFCSSMCIFNVLNKEININKLSIRFALGHSLGEYSALVASKVISIEDCSNLLKIRGELMQNAYQENMSGMSAVIGLECSALEKIIRDHSLNIEIANDNTPSQVVISGTIENLKKSESIIKDNGGKKIINLNVSAAFHSNIMKEAEEEMKLHLNAILFQKPIFSIISNFSAENSFDPKVIFNNLLNQMSNKVRWVESIKCLDKHKENNIIEIGPGKVLTGLIKKISNNFTVTNINSINDLENLSNEL